MKISDLHYGRTARIVECLRCGFRYADPLPAPDLIRLYEDLVDSEYSEGSEGRIRPFRRIVKRCRALLPQACTLVDVGAGIGLMCLAAREEGLDAWGVEPSAWAVEVGRKVHGLNLLRGTFPHPDLVGKRFDIITVIDVIEHLPEPLTLLREVHAALNPGGLAVVTTPNVRSLAARILGRRWWHYRMAHVGYFDRATMADALRRVGLALETSEPYVWFMTLGYLSTRLQRYLPVGPFQRALTRTATGRALLQKLIPVNPGDSVTYYARKAGKEGL
ncbi:MAG: class I SAM-dependent methyltransferase [Acidobacteria bacterium]|nr:class I SAM-dependent methyltransferase [Acidobacteriota bacterium]